VKRGAETRSLANEEQLLSITLDEAQALFSQPKTRRGRTAAGPLRELGADPGTGQPVVVREGRFGPYVTDGTTNASLRKGDDPETVTIERAAELLADRRAAGPRTGRRGAKKAGKATAAAKKATKKATKKAAPAKKAAPVRAAKKAGSTTARAKKATRRTSGAGPADEREPGGPDATGAADPAT
jgi:DNA topoisomerase-1